MMTAPFGDVSSSTWMAVNLPISEADLRRTRWLEDQGFRILRFWNNEVLSNTGGVLDAIMVAATNPSPGAPLRGAPPSPTRGEGKNDSEF
jgi:Protein of unknown function (DUF559)